MVKVSRSAVVLGDTLSHHQVTARMKWNKEVNKIVMRSFYGSEPAKRGYRKRMLNIWSELGVFEISEQRLAVQARAIRTNGWLSERDIMDIKIPYLVVLSLFPLRPLSCVS